MKTEYFFFFVEIQVNCGLHCASWTINFRPNYLLLETGRIIDAKKNQPPSWGGFLVRKGPTTGERGRLHSVTYWQFHKYQSVMDFLSNQHFRMWPSNRSFVQCAAVMTFTFIWIAATCISILTFTHFSASIRNPKYY